MMPQSFGGRINRDRENSHLPDVMRHSDCQPILDEHGIPKMAPEVERLVLRSLSRTIGQFANGFEALTTHDSLKVTIFGELTTETIYFTDHERHGFDSRGEEHIVSILGIHGICNAARLQPA
ncbi:MAG: hypothetical protein WAS36_02560 [Candidatus Saccharimonadales bacterium]